MRKFIAMICLITFVTLQYGKVISYWHCRIVAATAHCDCEQKMVSHAEEDHPGAPLVIAKEKAEEVFVSTELNHHQTETIITDHTAQSLYQPMIPGDHTNPVFQPPQA